MPILKSETVRNINGYDVNVNMWSDNLEKSCIEQALTAATVLPVFRSISIMPDGHCGYALPIGGVVPLIDAVFPYGVGMDIGCGMSTIKLSITDIDPEVHKKIRTIIRENIPIGKNRRTIPLDWIGFDYYGNIKNPIIEREIENARTSLGTLGGNNHFIEVQKGSDGYIYVMIHSGSRNLGKQICEYYHKLAIEKGVVPDGMKEYAYFNHNNSNEFQEYWSAMNFALDFAKENRRAMLDIIITIFKMNIPNIEVLDYTNIHHNYASTEKHYGKMVFVHRKGATLASEDTIGIIPGSKGRSSYMVKGLGELESYNSCSHGAGRTMSRGEARRKYSVEDCLATLRTTGLTCDERDVRADEGDESYKDINVVMKNQSDLVETIIELKAYQFPSIKEA